MKQLPLKSTTCLQIAGIISLIAGIVTAFLSLIALFGLNEYALYSIVTEAFAVQYFVVLTFILALLLAVVYIFCGIKALTFQKQSYEKQRLYGLILVGSSAFMITDFSFISAALLAACLLYFYGFYMYAAEEGRSVDKGPLFLQIAGTIIAADAFVSVAMILAVMFSWGDILTEIAFTYGYYTDTRSILTGLIVIMCIVLAVYAVLGTLGVRWSNHKAKAKTLYIFGIILSVLSLLSLIGSFTFGSVFLAAACLLYTYGAWLNKKPAEEVIPVIYPDEENSSSSEE